MKSNSIKLKEYWSDYENRKKLSEKIKEKWKEKEYREKLTEKAHLRKNTLGKHWKVKDTSRMKGHKAWNKDLTKEKDERISKYSVTLSIVNKGKKHSEESRIKMSNSRKGKPTWFSTIPKNNYKEILMKKCGGKYPSRKYDGISDAGSIKTRFLEKITSEGCFYPDYYPCEVCKRTNGTIFDFHHIIFRSEKPSHPKLHDLINILYVCRNCHTAFHRNISLRNRIVKERHLDEIFGLRIVEKEVYE